MSKNQTISKPQLRRERLRELTTTDLRHVAGGTTASGAYGGSCKTGMAQ